MFVVVSACSTSEGAPEENALTVLYSADAQGYLKECACETGGMLGGIARRATVVDRLRTRDPNVLLVDAGDFATSPGRGEGVGLVAARAMKRMRYDAVLPGEVELNLAPDFWKTVAKLDLPFVHTNFGTPELGPPDSLPLIVERDGRRIAILGLLGPDLPLLPPAQSRVSVTPAVDAAKAALARVSDEDVDLVLALTHMRGDAVEQLAREVPEIDVIVAGHTSKNLERPERRGEASYVSGGFLGQRLGRLRLSGRQLDAAEGDLIRLETSIKEDPEIARWVGVVSPS